MERERVEKWKARPATVQVPEVDEEDGHDDGGSLPGGRRRRRGSREDSAGSVSSSSANSSRRSSKEDGSERPEFHGDLVVENIEDAHEDFRMAT